MLERDDHKNWRRQDILEIIFPDLLSPLHNYRKIEIVILTIKLPERINLSYLPFSFIEDEKKELKNQPFWRLQGKDLMSE